MNKTTEPYKALTIGGSDSGGAAGIQADLKTWTALSVYGMSAITAVTAQNSISISAVHYLEPDLVAAQIEAIFIDYGTDALKTGFIGRPDLISSIADRLRFFHPQNIIIDPVLVNHQGQSMFPENVIQGYRRQLLPLANLVTPNWREASLLTNLPFSAAEDPKRIAEAADRLHQMGAQNVLITGQTHGEEMIDYWSDGAQLHPCPTARLKTANLHGSGDTLSAAICAYLGKGADMAAAIRQAQLFTADAIKEAASWKLGQGHGPLSHFH